jgi:hypothetical protein
MFSLSSEAGLALEFWYLWNLGASALSFAANEKLRDCTGRAMAVLCCERPCICIRRWRRGTSRQARGSEVRWAMRCFMTDAEAVGRA